jgi:uncharacterized protein with PIN domain
MTTIVSTFIKASVAISCADCGTPFWMDSQLESQRRSDHRNFYCPNGHTNFWPQETEAEKYKRLYGAAEDRVARIRAERDQAEASRRAWKGQTTKLRNRAAAGACPFCGAGVYQLARHVARKHAEEAARDLTETEVSTS